MPIKTTTDADGYRHETEFTPDGKPIADRKYDRYGDLIGEGIYQAGKLVGYKKYFIDHDGYRHEAEFTPDDRPVADKKYDQHGDLVGEGIYRFGKFIGYKKYFTDQDGYRHEVEYDAADTILDDRRYDQNGMLVPHDTATERFMAGNATLNTEIPKPTFVPTNGGREEY